MKIKHIVISGGGINLFTIYGCLKYLNKKKLWQIKNINHSMEAHVVHYYPY